MSLSFVPVGRSAARPLPLLLTASALLLLFGAASVFAGDAPSGARLSFFPDADVFPPAAADPHRTGFGIQWMHFPRTAIPGAGDTRVGLRLGGRFGVVRTQPGGSGGSGWQFSIEGGFNAQFDRDHSLDNIGWDGRYGLLAAASPRARLAYKLGLMHDSAHIGDEYMERTGRKRVGYTRHEIAAAAAWSPDDRVRIYLEGGWGFRLRNEQLMEPGRMQLGMEYESPLSEKRRIAWYAAVDISAMEERDWRVDRSLQAGVVTQAAGKTWRVGIEWYRGRPPLGEFFLYTEEYVSAGVWIDL